MILGKRTLDETRDYLAVADYRFKETGKAYDALLEPKPADIKADWDALRAKWTVARKQIADGLTERAVKGFPMPSDVIATQDQWNQIEGFIQNQELVHGSLQDVTRRIEKVSGKQILYPNQPSQNSADVDIELFKKLDTTTKDLDAAADRAKEEAKNAATSNTGLIIGGSILVTLVGISLAKRYI